jgi:hypothetical protein
MSTQTSTPPYTLAQARAAIIRLWPGRDALAPVWVAYHEACALLFAEAALSDPDHPREAAYLANVERRSAQVLADRIAAGDTTSPWDLDGVW